MTHALALQAVSVLRGNGCDPARFDDGSTGYIMLATQEAVVTLYRDDDFRAAAGPHRSVTYTNREGQRRYYLHFGDNVPYVVPDYPNIVRRPA